VSLARRMIEHRPEIILVVLVGLSFVSLLTGTRAGFLGTFLRKTVSLTAYPFVRTMDYTSRATDYTLDLVFAYDRYRSESASLRRELAVMKAALAEVREMRLERGRLKNMLGLVRNEPRLTLEPARVLESYRGVLKIDRGARQHIGEAMGVISENGVVGIVIEVDAFTSTVATLHHVDCRVGAMVQRNRIRAYDGIIHAGGSNLNLFCTMDYIDLKDDVRVGDQVVTSPESVFPSGYPIGSITAIHGGGSMWKTAEIEPTVDPYRLDEVFVVRQTTPAAEELEGPLPPENLASGPSESPDNRSLQERYAP